MMRSSYFLGLVIVLLACVVEANGENELKFRSYKKEQGAGCAYNKAKLSCGCCANFDIPKIKLNETGCVNVTYLQKDIGVSFIFTLNGHLIYNETVSVRNPPPICFGIPYLETYVSLCVAFYNLDYSKHSVSGCIKIEARVSHVRVEEIELGCFRLPPGGQHLSEMPDYVRIH